jgi:hypothetical protein
MRDKKKTTANKQNKHKKLLQHAANAALFSARPYDPQRDARKKGGNRTKIGNISSKP